MSSALRAPSQIGAREKFLIGVRAFDSSGGVAPENATTAGFSVTASATVGNGGIYTSAEVQAFAGYSSDIPNIAVGTSLYRDLGKELVVIGTDDKYLARFRLARLVNSATAEGIGANGNVWLKVWSAAGTGVAVARTG